MCFPLKNCFASSSASLINWFRFIAFSSFSSSLDGFPTHHPFLQCSNAISPGAVFKHQRKLSRRVFALHFKRHRFANQRASSTLLSIETRTVRPRTNHLFVPTEEREFHGKMNRNNTYSRRRRERARGIKKKREGHQSESKRAKANKRQNQHPKTRPPKSDEKDEEEKNKKAAAACCVSLTILGAMMPASVTIFSGGGPVLCFINVRC